MNAATLRTTGAGFTYNIGRIIAAAGPFLVAPSPPPAPNALDSATSVLFWIATVPIIGILMRAPACDRNKRKRTRGLNRLGQID